MIFKPIPTETLKAGDRVSYLGALRTVREVTPSPGRGFEVTFEDGPSANFLYTTFIADQEATDRMLSGMLP